jgi:hypothetical protein
MKTKISNLTAKLLIIIVLIFYFGCKDTPEYLLNIEVVPEGSGSVNLTPAGGTYKEGTEVSLSHQAASSFTFLKWSGTDAGLISNNKLIMSKDMSIIANFEKLLQNGQWSGYYTIFEPVPPYDIEFYVKDNTITKTGSSSGYSLILHAYFSNVTITHNSYGDLAIKDGKFSYTSTNFKASGTFTSSNKCIGTVNFDENSNHAAYSFEASPK